MSPQDTVTYPKLPNSDKMAQNGDNAVSSLDIPGSPKELVIRMIADHLISPGHFAAEVDDTKEPSREQTWRTRLDASFLKLVLPSGIYLRYADSRPALMKALIVGPLDTPYENGLFEFNIFCPDNFPASPICFHFKQGKAIGNDFNPHLSVDGTGNVPHRYG